MNKKFWSWIRSNQIYFFIELDPSLILKFNEESGWIRTWSDPFSLLASMHLNDGNTLASPRPGGRITEHAKRVGLRLSRRRRIHRPSRGCTNGSRNLSFEICAAGQIRMFGLLWEPCRARSNGRCRERRSINILRNKDNEQIPRWTWSKRASKGQGIIWGISNGSLEYYLRQGNLFYRAYQYRAWHLPRSSSPWLSPAANSLKVRTPSTGWPSQQQRRIRVRV